MSVAAPTAGLSPTRSDLYRSEVRFGVVMYGGVSLAIYINGVANELYEMACATPKVLGKDGGGGTRDVYRKASLLLASEELRKSFARHLSDPQAKDPFSDAASLARAPRARFVVDVISGTSAGGINGIFLAKALANGQDFSPLKKLWIQEGNIENLLNDEASYQGLEYARVDSPPQSLLNSDRMYIKLLDAFQNMTTAMQPIGKSESPLVDEIDLFVTTTDIRGSVVPLRLFDEVVYEKRFKQVYHFQYAAAAGESSRNDLAEKNAPFLAFAARCTSSFPFAFEPMAVVDAQRLCNAKPGGGAIDFGVWETFFTGLSSDDTAKDRWRSRAFGDGGYLDNKPFSYVVDALSWRLGELPMERKLIYVEPAPAHPETERQIFADKPDAIENAFAALNTIPRYETIREDLEAILARNRRIERVERIVRQVEADIENSPVDPFKRIKLIEGKVPDWTSLDLGQMIEYYGVAFLPYQRLRMASVTDDVAERLAVWWDIDRRSDRFYALKAMARAWREAKYYETESKKKPGQTAPVNKFLDDYDVKYRLRRVGFLLRKVHQLQSLVVRTGQAGGKAPSDIERRLAARLAWCGYSLSLMNFEALIAALNCLAHGFGEALQELRASVWMPVPDDPAAAQVRAASHDTLDRLLRLLMGEQLDPPLTELPASDESKKWVPIKIEALPLPSRLRTLQENVFERAQALFELANEASLRTQIQDLLEEDLARLKDGYASVIRWSPDRKTPLVRDLLGDPKLVPLPAATPGGDQPTVVIQVKDTVDFCDGALNSPEGRILREFLAEYYVRFDEYDQMSFPLYYDTGTGEPSTVEVLRVSPEDARGLIDERNDQGDTGRQRRKLAGTALFNFGAFLDVRWRRNDIMWGRLDGCERLLAALFPATDNKEDTAIHQALLQEAQRSIIREEMQPEGYALLVDRFAEALAMEKEATLKEAFDKLWAHLDPADDAQRSTQTAQALKAVLGDAGMVDYVRRYYEVNRKLDTAPTMKTGARALTITGRILEGSEKHYRMQGSRMVWVTRGGRALQVLLTVSTPGDLPHAMLRHWLALLYLFEVLIVLGAMAFSETAARTFGLTCLAVTVALHAASLIAGDLMYSRRGWVKLIAGLVAVGVLALALLGAAALLSDGGLTSIVCGGGEDHAWLRQMLCPSGG
jgi:patatin-related protein